MMRRSLLLLTTISAFFGGSVAYAHHSTAAYDYASSATLEGTVTEFLWTNPHMFIGFQVKDANGKDAVWNIECGTPNINVRHGWKQSDIKAGDKLKMTIHPMRDGSKAGTLDTVTLADGRLLYGPGHDLSTPGGPSPQ
jgi:hypothetical protein